jgi:hypothetical protein
MVGQFFLLLLATAANLVGSKGVITVQHKQNLPVFLHLIHAQFLIATKNLDALTYALY